MTMSLQKKEIVGNKKKTCRKFASLFFNNTLYTLKLKIFTKRNTYCKKLDNNILFWYTKYKKIKGDENSYEGFIKVR